MDASGESDGRELSKPLERTQQDLLQSLEQHPLFHKDCATSTTFPHNILAIDRYSQVYYCDGDNTINVFSLSHLHNAASGGEVDTGYKVLRCEPDNINFEVRSLFFNRKSSLLCVWGDHNCVVINISVRVLRELSSREYKPAEVPEVKVKATEIGSYFYRRDPSVVIQRVHWHPLSDCHLAILTSDSVLRMYDLASDVEEAEQTFRLRSLLPFAADPHSAFSLSSPFVAPDFDMIDFCFASPHPSGATSTGFAGEGATWNSFTTYFISDEGPIYVLTPILPYNWPILIHVIHEFHPTVMDATMFAELRELVEDRIAALTTVVDDDDDDDDMVSRMTARYHEQLRWLMEVQGHAVRKNRAAVGQEGEETSPGWVMSRRPTTFKTPAVLQGPINPIDTEDPLYKRIQEEESVCGISVVPPFPVSRRDSSPAPGTVRVLFRMFRSGLLEVFIAFEDFDPEWNPRNFSHSDDIKWLLLYEREDLELPSSVHTSSFTPAITFDPERLDWFYVRHAAGVHRVMIPWLTELYTAAHSGEARSDDEETTLSELPDMPRSRVDNLLNTIPIPGADSREAAPIVGFLPIFSLGVGHFFVALTHLRRCYGRSMLVEAELDSMTLLSMAEPRTAIKAPEEDEFILGVKKLLAARTRQLPLLIPKHRLDYDDPKSLEFLLSTCAALRENYITPIQRVYDNVKIRQAVIEDLKKKQRRQIKDLNGEVEGQIERSRALDQRLKKVSRMQELLNLRIRAVQDIVGINQPRISIAEKKYHQDLVEKEAAVAMYKKKIRKLQLQSRDFLEPQTSTKCTLSDGQVERILTIAGTEDQMLRETQAGYEKLRRDLEVLEGDLGT